MGDDDGECAQQSSDDRSKWSEYYGERAADNDRSADPAHERQPHRPGGGAITSRTDCAQPMVSGFSGECQDAKKYKEWDADPAIEVRQHGVQQDATKDDEGPGKAEWNRDHTQDHAQEKKNALPEALHITNCSFWASSSVGAVYDRAYFVDSRKSARS